MKYITGIISVLAITFLVMLFGFYKPLGHENFNDMTASYEPEAAELSAPQVQAAEEEEATEEQEAPSAAHFASEAVVPEPLSVLGKAKFADELYFYDGSKLMFMAQVFDSKTNEFLAGLDVEEYCGHEVLNVYSTDNAGIFRFEVSDKCADGNLHWARVMHNEMKSDTDHMILQRMVKETKRGSGAQVLPMSLPIADAQGVPEFSTVTLALVILGGTLGLVMLRRE